MFGVTVILYFVQILIGHLLRPDIVHFHFTCLGTEIFVRELTLSNTLSSNPKSSHSVDPQFFHKLLLYLHYNFTTNFFIVQRHGSMTIHDYATQKDQFLLTGLPFKTNDRFARTILSYAILSVLNVNNISCLQLWEGADITLSKILSSSDISIKSQGR
jgi:hypothetical protein